MDVFSYTSLRFEFAFGRRKKDFRAPIYRGMPDQAYGRESIGESVPEPAQMVIPDTLPSFDSLLNATTAGESPRVMESSLEPKLDSILLELRTLNRTLSMPPLTSGETVNFGIDQLLLRAIYLELLQDNQDSGVPIDKPEPGPEALPTAPLPDENPTRPPRAPK
jgi:hypothetical protein